jgi:hypothetical protein
MKIPQQSWQDRSPQAFSMLEVMIAIGIFFTSVFVILQLTSQQLRMARSLQTLDVDTGTLPSLIVMTNALEEGPLPMEIKIAFEDTNPGFSCEGMVHEYATNGLFQVDYVIYWQQEGRVKQARNSILMWRPTSGRRTPRLRR